ncbi:hypothetical protein CBS147343_4642 [Aspergillus niger]|nr:hypothetical protein CBS133816_365 [Aspergillus niger]KAI2852210.1 hypothetical protein CBS11350_688 [Aspergillus niger]KAI2863320.1 hypothetical protein CBS12448_3877 [Aspergillus niger]KAI2908686.1 hypothetical protein CBS147371_9843 [Aspergillus niger]KAI2933602.1 hypothetical protein CBS147320_1458 [Aspergillus niger]
MKIRRERLLYGAPQQVIYGLIKLPLKLIWQNTEPSSGKRPRTVPAEAIKVAIFCALSYEATAVKYCLDEELACQPRTIGPKNYMYSFGRIGEHKLVIAQPVHMGLAKAAQCAATVRQQFPHVQFALLVGIGAGIPCPNRCDIRLGDIAVGIPRGSHPGVIQYDLGIYEEDEFVPQGCVNKPPSILISADGSLEEDEIMNRSPLREILKDITKNPGYERPSGQDILYDDDFHHINTGGDCTECEKSDWKKIVPRTPRSLEHPVVHRGLILSGNGVIKTPQDRNRLRRGHDDAICFEMEGAGIADVIPCLVVRGICDYADTHKQDGWHHFAAAAAAAHCKSILLKIDTQGVGDATEMSSLLSDQDDLLRAIRAMIQCQSLATALWPLKYLLPLETSHDGKLVTLCVPSFAFAAAFCNTLEEPQWDPEEVLGEFLQSPRLNLDQIYLPILNRMLHGQTKSQQERLLREFKEVVGPILILQRALSVKSLSILTGNSEKLIKRRLGSLHSIIKVPDDDTLPVEHLHWSLRTFLHSPDTRETTPFWIDEKETHSELTAQCQKLMEYTFEQNTHNPPASDKPQVDSDSGNGTYNNTTPELQYACQYWVHHLLNSADPVDKLDTLFPFLQEHFFHWVQVLNVISDRSTITDMINRLQSIKHDHNMSRFLEDVKKSILKNEGRRIEDEEDDITRYTVGQSLYMAGCLGI